MSLVKIMHNYSKWVTCWSDVSDCERRHLWLKIIHVWAHHLVCTYVKLGLFVVLIISRMFYCVTYVLFNELCGENARWRTFLRSMQYKLYSRFRTFNVWSDLYAPGLPVFPLVILKAVHTLLSLLLLSRLTF